MFGDADLPTFFADFGVPVIFGGVTRLGNFDRPVEIKEADQGFGGVETAFPSIRLPYNAFSPMPDSGDVLQVNGAWYSISEPTAESDGAVVCFGLKAASVPTYTGPAGGAPPELAEGDVITATTGQTISAQQVVAIVEGLAQIADSSTLSQINEVFGIATGGAVTDTEVTIQTYGPYVYNGWNWTPGLPVFLGLGGALTQTAPSSGFLQIIGSPIDATTLFIDLEPPVAL